MLNKNSQGNSPDTKRKRIYFMLPYTCIPTWVVTLLKGKPYSLMVLITLCIHRNVKTNNTKFMSIPQIGKLSGVSERQSYNCIEELTNLNLIKELKNEKGQRIFHIHCLDNDTATKKEVIEQAESLEEQWTEFLEELEGNSDTQPEDDRSLKQQLINMEENTDG